jgi:hypothetical protein
MLATAGSAGGASRPAVTPVDLTPLTIHGVRFRPAETVLVRVIVRGGPRSSKTVTTGKRGRFVARFRSLDLRECAFFIIRAIGSHGSRAFFTAHPPPCGPAP